MRTPSQFQSAVRQRLARWIAPEVRGSASRASYFQQQKSCQIPQLWFLFEQFFGRRDTGQFVEIGANDGVYVSNTWGLAHRGWRGLMVEPVAELAAACRSNHAHHPGVITVNSAIGRPGVSELQLSVAGPLTTANAAVLNEYKNLDWARNSLTERTVIVPCTTLDALLEEYGIATGFEVLVIDVEGFETEVMSGFDLPRWQPQMIIIELADTHPDLASTAIKDHALARLIVSAGYEVAYKDSINTVFVSSHVWDAVRDSAS